MKHRRLTQIFVLSIGLILLSVLLPVNQSSLLASQQSFTLLRDGVPLPPPGPLPPPPPPKQTGSNFLDGTDSTTGLS